MATAEASGSASGVGSLVDYGQRSRNVPRTGCPHAAEGLRLAVTDVDGPRYLQLRCDRRSCPYCGRLWAYEDAELIYLDALADQPRVALTLTTQTPIEELDPEDFRRGSQRVWEALRRRFGKGVQYVGRIEATTGKAATSGGRRRLHGHYLVKGIDPVHVLEVEQIVRRAWKKRTGAYVVEAAELRSAGGAIRYLALHHAKPEQALPADWRGMRLRFSQGYFHAPVAELRKQARHRQAVYRRRRQMEKHEGASAEWAAVAAELEVSAREEAIAANGAELVRVMEPRGRGGVVEPRGRIERVPAPVYGPAEDEVRRQHRQRGDQPAPQGEPGGTAQAPGARVDAQERPGHGPLRGPFDPVPQALVVDDGAAASLLVAVPAQPGTPCPPAEQGPGVTRRAGEARARSA